jgi:amidase
MAERPPEIWRWTAAEVAHGVRAGAISATEAAQSALGRIDAVNPRLNALVDLYPEKSLAAARAADEAVRAGGPLGPLHGVPTAIKVNTDEAGHATTDGIAAFKDRIANADAPVTANLRNAGAIFVGRSNTPAFSFRWFSDNDAHGRTLNPWDPARTPGGSSGGAGSAAASGMVHVAHGNDIGGSVRYPAYVCNVAGIRPTVGRIPVYWGEHGRDPGLSSQLMAVEGPLARSVGDLRLALDAMTAFDARDSYYAPVAAIGPAVQRPIRVGLVRDAGARRPEPVVNAALDAAARWLEDAGYRVEEIEIPALAEAWRLWWLLALEDFRLALPFVEQVGDENMKRAAELYYAVAAEMHGPNPSQEAYMLGYARRNALASAVQQALAATPVVLLPNSAERGLTYGDDVRDVARMREVIAAQWPMMAIPTIAFPAISVPTGIVDGLPMGVQLLASRFREDLLLDAADVIEARAGTFTPIDPRG